jgi:hypothetical protein
MANLKFKFINKLIKGLTKKVLLDAIIDKIKAYLKVHDFIKLDEL